MAAGCGHEHHHGHDDADHVKAGEGQQDILFLDVDREQVTALNEKQTGSAAHIIRPVSYTHLTLPTNREA